MKKFKIAASILALLTLMALNFKHAVQGYGAFPRNALALGSNNGGNGGSSGGSNSNNGGNGGSAGGPEGTTSSNNSSNCCGWWGSLWGTCDERKESIKIDVKCTIVTTSYYDANGHLVGTTIVKGGQVTASFSGSYARSSTSTEEYKMKGATKVNCPTDGSCNNCSEYTPTCN